MLLSIAIYVTTLLSSLATTTTDADYKVETDIQYRPALAKDDAYANQMCRLDVYHPADRKGFATVVWFHGGGLEQGHREVPESLKGEGLAIVGVEYRLAPKVKSPAYVEDAAAAVAWTVRHISEYGGDPKAVFVAGHSAGGYLVNMVTLDKRWLAAEGVDANMLAGAIAYSGHAITHFTIRKERGIADTIAVVDDMAPLYHVRADAPPMLLLTGDREKEMLGRYEEVAYLARMLKVVGHKDTTLFELQGFDHNGMTNPGHELLLKFVRAHHPEVTTRPVAAN